VTLTGARNSPRNTTGKIGEYLRDIIEDQKFTKGCATLGDPKRLDEAMYAATWALARDPEKASWSVPGTTKLRVMFIEPFPGLPALRIFLTIDGERTITLRWIESVDDETISD